MCDLVSVVMPCYNSGETIHNSISAILAQDYYDLELIIIDDFSNDNSVEIIKSFIDPRVILLRQSRNFGAGVARNVGLKRAKGRFIAFCDSDDIWVTNKISLQLNYFANNLNVNLLCSRYYRVNVSQTVKKLIAPKSKVRYKDLLKSCEIPMSTAIIDTTRLRKIPEFRDLRIRQDYAFWLDLYQLNEVECHCLNDITMKYLTNNSSISSNIFRSARKHLGVVRTVGNVKGLKLFWYFLIYIYKAISKRL